MEEHNTKIIHFKETLPIIDCLKLKEYLTEKNLPHYTKDNKGVWKFINNTDNKTYKTVGIRCESQYYYTMYIAITEFFIKNNLII